MGRAIQQQKEGGLVSEYKDKIDKMKWSYSRLTSFEHCKYEFYLNYILKDDDKYLSEGNFYAEVGSYVHEILAMIFEGKLTLDEASQYYVDNFDQNVLYKTKKSIMNKTFETCADYFATVDFAWLKDYEILGVEKKVEFKIEEYDFVGYIDLLVRDKRDGKIVVIDNKSSEYPFKSNGEVKAKSKDSFEKYKKQMYLYSYAIMEQYGEFPKEITWNHFKDGGCLATIKFSKDEYDQSVRWLIDTIHSIEREEEFPSNQDYFYCTNLCNFRSSCEYAKSLRRAAWNK